MSKLYSCFHAGYILNLPQMNMEQPLAATKQNNTHENQIKSKNRTRSASTCLAPWRCRAIVLFQQQHFFKPTTTIQLTVINTRRRRFSAIIFAVPGELI